MSSYVPKKGFRTETTHVPHNAEDGIRSGYQPPHSTTNPHLVEKSNEADMDVNLVRMQTRELKLQRHIRFVQFFSRIITALLAGYMFAAMAYALQQYYSTRDIKLAGGGQPWGPTNTLWSTFLLLAISGITLLMNFATLFAYCWGVKAAELTDSWMTKLGYAITAVHAIIWAVTMGLFKMAFNTGIDLWGYSCSSSADAIQNEVQSFINFPMLCNIQGDAWVVGIVQTVGYILTFVAFVIGGLRTLNKRKMAKARQQSIRVQGF